MVLDCSSSPLSCSSSVLEDVPGWVRGRGVWAVLVGEERSGPASSSRGSRTRWWAGEDDVWWSGRPASPSSTYTGGGVSQELIGSVTTQSHLNLVFLGLLMKRNIGKYLINTTRIQFGME